MVKPIKVQCNAFDADRKNGFTSESVHVPQPVDWIWTCLLFFTSSIRNNAEYVQLQAF